MKYAHLGRSGVQVSRLALGTMNFGPHTSEADAFAIMDRALEEGVQLFDTANVYGWKVGEGVTEQIIGRWFALGGRRRERVVLATKVYGKTSDDLNDQRLSARHIRRACEDSLRRLRTDHVDLYQMHHVWRDVTWDEVWQGMDLLVEQGKAIYVGSSNFAGWTIAQACEAARARHSLGLVSEQSLYHLLERSIELEVLPACRAYGLGVLPWSPLASGLLAGVSEPGGRRAGEKMQKQWEENREALDAFRGFCTARGETPAVVALAWLLHQPGVTAPIVGPRTMEQLTSALRAVDLVLTPEDLAALDRIFPGPGGPAPEAYAW